MTTNLYYIIYDRIKVKHPGWSRRAWAIAANYAYRKATDRHNNILKGE